MNCVRSRRLCVLFSVLAAAFIAAVVALFVALAILRPWDTQAAEIYAHAAVAANGVECARIGRETLEKKGSAVDAAIATLFCEGLGCAQCMGLGGGFLATIYDAQTGQIRVMNARERAPAAAHENMFANASSVVGGLAIAVPGELRGYGEMYRAYGRLPWEELVKPAAKLARRGHTVSEYMARVLDTYYDMIKAQPSMREVYLNPETGKGWKMGDVIRDPVMARTLDIIAEEGPEAMHNGSLTAPLVRDIRAIGGIITEEDLRNYRAEWQEPIEVPITDDLTLYSVGLPGSGSVLAFILNMLRGFVGKGTDVHFNTNLYWHRVIEIFKYAYAKRTGLGDPNRDTSNFPFDILELEKNLTKPDWARTYRRLIEDARTFNDWRHYGALFEGANDHGTAHVVVVAPDGSVVSATSTINYIWGSQRRSPRLGVMLNNEMDDFAVPNRESAYGMPPSPANLVGPGLQPLSSMTPSIVLNRDRSLKLVVGAAGGTKITTQVALITAMTLWEGLKLHGVISRPRLHHQLVPMSIEYEDGFDESIINSLQRRGHEVTKRGPTAGFAAMVGCYRNSKGNLIPQTDRRRPGSTDGF